jgi:hypothetical protein
MFVLTLADHFMRLDANGHPPETWTARAVHYPFEVKLASAFVSLGGECWMEKWHKLFTFPTHQSGVKWRKERWHGSNSAA